MEETTTTTAAPVTTMAEEDDMMDLATDVGVDLDAGVIKVGLLSDLTGPFGALVTPIVTGHEAYWDNVNKSGGINGMTVELVVRDTQYVIDNHVQMYAELKDEVVAFGHSTGSPHTVAINDQLQEDGILAVPLTWYSGWSDPALNDNLVPHGVPYCIEAMNSIDYIVNNRDVSTIAIVSLPGDYGLDSATGAMLAAEALGLEVVYDGSGKIIPGEDMKPIADEIVASGADLAFVTTTPGTFSQIYGQAIAQGYVAAWSGALPSWNPAYVDPDSAIKEAIERDFIASGYISLWSSPRAADVRDLITGYQSDAAPNDYYGEGIVEATILHQALLKAVENGDFDAGRGFGRRQEFGERGLRRVRPVGELHGLQPQRRGAEDFGGNFQAVGGRPGRGGHRHRSLGRGLGFGNRPQLRLPVRLLLALRTTGRGSGAAGSAPPAPPHPDFVPSCRSKPTAWKSPTWKWCTTTWCWVLRGIFPGGAGRPSGGPAGGQRSGQNHHPAGGWAACWTSTRVRSPKVPSPGTGR